MSLIYLLIHQENWIAGSFLAAAFIFTFRQGRSPIWLAAGFYCVGASIAIGSKVCLWSLSVVLGYSMSDSVVPNAAMLEGVPIPALAAVYGIASMILIWPWISQKNALFLGKILHLI